MFCRNCGKEIKDGSSFCPYCGYHIAAANIVDNKKEQTEPEKVLDIKQQKKETKKAKRKAFFEGYAKYRRIMRRASIAVIVLWVIVEAIRAFIPQNTDGKETVDENPTVQATESETTAEQETSSEQADNSIDAEQNTENSQEEEETSENLTDFDWEKTFVRQNGPAASISVWSADENGIEFAVSVGASGYTAYVDLRDCEAYSLDSQTYEYDYGDGYKLDIMEYESNTISVLEAGDSPFGISLTGIYVPEEEADYTTCEYVFPDSDVRELTLEDCTGLSAAECRIARNEIYARHGRLFQDEQLQGYFDCCSWYQGSIEPDNFSDDMLNEIEKRNLEVIGEYEAEIVE